MSAACRFCGEPLAMPEGVTIPLACGPHMEQHRAECALQRVSDSYADATNLPGGGYHPQWVDENFLELVCDLADPLITEEYCSYALVRWAEVNDGSRHSNDGMMGYYVSFRKVAKVFDPATGRMEYGHTEDAASFPLVTAKDVLDPNLVEKAIQWGPENGYVVARFLMALGQLFPKEFKQ